MKKLIPFILCIFIVASCHAQNKQTLTNQTINDIDFNEVTFHIDKKTGDTILTTGILENVQLIQNIPCHNDIVFNKEWEIIEFVLAEEHIFGNHTFPKGSQIKLNTDISKLEHYFAIRNSKVYVVNSCKLPVDIIVSGIPCMAMEEVIFKPDWELLACILGTDDTFLGHQLVKGTFIRFDENEEITLYCLNNPFLDGYHCKGDNYLKKLWMGSTGIKLYPNGKLKYFQHMEEISIQGILCKPSGARGGISLYENGMLKSCTSAKDQTIQNTFCGKNYNIELNRSGEIISAQKEKIF